MKKFGQRLLSALLAVGMLLSAFPLSAFAEGETPKMAPQILNPENVGENVTADGVYDLPGGTYSGWLYVIASGDVTINLKGDVETTIPNTFITVAAGCNLTINGNGYTLESKTIDGQNLINVDDKNAEVTLKTGTFAATATQSPVIGNEKGGTVRLDNARVAVNTQTGDTGQCINNTNSILHITNGSELDNGPDAKYACVVGDTVYLNDGTLTAGAKKSSALKVVETVITGGEIKNSQYGVFASYDEVNQSGNTLDMKIDGNVVFENNTEDVHLDKHQTFTLTEKYTRDHAITVGIDESLPENTKRQITTSGTSTEEMLKYVASVNPAYSVGYNKAGKYLYLWKHTHTWKFTAKGNTITAACTEPDCEYYTHALTLTLNAPEAAVEGETDKSYEASSKDDLAVTGTEIGKITYEGTGDTVYSSSETAPVEAGTYRASITAGGATAAVTYTIAPRTHTIQLVNCTGKTEAVKGEKVTLKADEMPGKEFTGWNVTGNVTDEDQSKKGEITFTMPDEDVTVEATFKDIVFDPGKPVVPGQPSKPSTPSEPSTPTTPSEPEKPSAPSTPDESAKPSKPSTPTTPSEPEKPDTPSTPETPSQPDAPEPTPTPTPTPTPNPEPAEDPSSGVAGAVIVGAGAAVLGSGAAVMGWDAYYIGTELYLKWVLPFGVIPTTRETLALMLWNDADQPAPQNSTYYSDINEDNPESQAAARWAVEKDLIKPGQDDDTAFVPDGFVNIFEVAKAWKKAQKLKK